MKTDVEEIQLDLADELRRAVAAYLPDRQIITFSAAMEVMPKGTAEQRGLKEDEIGYFFHEWIHYLHNVSTIHGITAFANLVELWGAFRATADCNGFGEGQGPSSHLEGWRVEERLKLFMTTRGSAATRLPNSATPDRCRVISYSPASREGLGRDQISMIMVVSNEEGETTEIETSVGAHEILESVAMLLEHRVVQALGGERTGVSSVVPYHALVLLSKHVAPSLTEEEVLMCGLASLHSTFPADALGKFLPDCNAVAEAGGSVRQRIKAVALAQLEHHKIDVQRLLDRIDSVFKPEFGFGRAAQEVVSIMRRNLEARFASPFFELDLISRVKAEGSLGFDSLMTEIMKTHGICGCKQERVGGRDELARDDLFEFAVVSGDSELTELRRIMQASFDFLSRHFTTTGILLATEALKPRECLFYTSCRLPLRSEREDDCRSRPWLAAIAEGDRCWYGAGVLQFRRVGSAP
nr:hypothetical protein [Achromobacter ruhlandii]